MAGQTSDTAGGAVTVNEALQVLVPQVLVTDQLTVVDPPQLDGAVGLVGVLTSVPPLLLTVASQAVNSLFTAVWV